MSKRIEAPGRSALWTEAALRALTGTAFLIHEDGMIQANGGSLGATAAREIALDAMAIATAFEAACIAAHASSRSEQTHARFWLQCDTGQIRCDGCGSFVFRFYHEDHSSCDVCGRVCTYYDSVTVLPLPSGADATAHTPTGGEERA